MNPVIVTKALASPGLPVMRGRDWSWGDQDKKGGTKGKIIDVGGDLSSLATPSGWVKVEWDDGSRYTYRMGMNDKFDLYAYIPGFYDSKSQGVLTVYNGKPGVRVVLNSNASPYARERLADRLEPLIIRSLSHSNVIFEGIQGGFKPESFDICVDQTVKVVSTVEDSSKFGYLTSDPSPRSIHKFDKGDVVYVKEDGQDSWTIYSDIKPNVPYNVEEVKGKAMKLIGINSWQLQDHFMSRSEREKVKIYNQTRLETTPMMDMGSLQKNVVSIAENSKQTNIKQNGINTDNPDYSGRPLELPSIIISLERGERVEGTRLHS